jgi:hypothetical protein
MGRPPIGKRAMTSTERSRRYRAGKTVKPEPAPTPQAEPSAENDQEIVRREREQLRAIRAILRLTELEQERDRYKQMLEGRLAGLATKREKDAALLESIIWLLEHTNEVMDEMLRVEHIEAAPDGRIHLTLARQAPADDSLDRTTLP